jgi:hypothetical protein
MWLSHSALIKSVMNADIIDIPSGGEHTTDRAVQEIQRSIGDNLYDIQMRNEAILFHDLPTKRIGRLGTAVNDVKVHRFSLSLVYLLFNSVLIVAQLDFSKHRHDHYLLLPE